MLENMKDELRISGQHHNQEVIDLMEAAKADLILSGVHKDKCKISDPLIRRAITVYCKANFGYEDEKQSAKFQDSYYNLKQHLTLSQEYTKGDDINEP